MADRSVQQDIAPSAVKTRHLAASSVTTPALMPTTGFVMGDSGGSTTTTNTSFSNIATLLTHTAGITNERIILNLSVIISASANAGLVQVSGAGNGITVPFSSVGRVSVTTPTTVPVFAIIDVPAGIQVTVVLQGEIITSGTLTLNNTSITNTWSGTYVIYGNTRLPASASS